MEAMREFLSNSSLTFNAALNLANWTQFEPVVFSAAARTVPQKNLSEDGRRRLRGVLLDRLKEEKELLSVQHEMTTAVHLLSCGFDFEFQDMGHGVVRVHILAPKHPNSGAPTYRNAVGNVGRFIYGQKSVWKKLKLPFLSFPR
ncbi:hypothetical protein [Paraburkholderia xenovorans]|uniref:hypothetical protein n=1 Tax=Paraburkholderia xenovorans TaxID=36873 RepID=UPI0015C5756C|nr:hypothetical protein [Paraburkholderia xenovorans]NPT34341.1 hypothetical protein [Paraburkholderia xenovorans]